MYFVLLVATAISLASGQCDELLPPLVVPGPSGSFDFPSRTPAGNYLNSMKCAWRLRCGSGQSLGLAQRIATPSGRVGDYWEYFAADGVTQLVPRQLGVDLMFAFLFHTSEVLVRFNADSDGVVARGMIFASNFSCHNHICNTNKAFGVYHVQTNTVGAFSTAGTQYHNESCSWRLTCANPSEYLYMWNSVFVFGGAQLTITDNLGRSHNSLMELTYDPSVYSLTIDFVSTPSMPTVTFQFGCQKRVPATLDACVGNLVTHSASSDTLLLPATKARGVPTQRTPPVLTDPQAASFNMLDCKWRVECGPGFYPFIVGWGRVYTSDSYQFWTPDGSTQLFSMWAEVIGTLSHQTNVRRISYQGYTNAVDVVYRTQHSSFRNDAGSETFVNVSFTCVNATCQSNSTNGFATLRTSQGVTRSVARRGEYCSWTFACENQTNWIVMYIIEGRIESVVDGNGTAIPSSRWGSPMRAPQVTITTDPLVLHEASYRLPTFSTQCIESMEGVCEEGQVYDLKEGGSASIIRVPEQPNHYYYSGMTCWFKLTCPAGWTIALSGAIRTASEEDALEIYNKANTTLVHSFSGAIVRCKSSPLASLSTCPRVDQRDYLFQFFNFMVPGDGLYLRWITDGFLDDDGIDYRGNPLRWYCYESTCPNNSTAPVIYEWAEGSSNATNIVVTTGNARCTFIARCANPALQLYFFLVETIRGGALSFFDTVTGLQTEPMRSEQASQYSELRIVYSGAIFGTLNISFECYDRSSLMTCGAHLPNISLSGYGGQLRVPMYRSAYVNDLRCTFELTCPSNMVVATSGVLQLAEDDDRIEFYDSLTWEYLGKINSNRSALESASTTRSVQYMWRRSRVTMIFISDLFLAASGLINFRWECLVSACGSNSTLPVTFTHTRGQPDIRVVPRYLNEECHIILRCSAPSEWLAFDRVTETTIGFARFTTATGTPVPYPNTSSMIADVPLHMFWDAPSALETYAFSFGCFFNADFLNSACAPQTTLIVSQPTQTLTVPLNSLNSFYFNKMRCNWRIECLPGQFIAIQGALQTPVNDTFDFVRATNRNLATVFSGRGSWSFSSQTGNYTLTPFRFADVHQDNVLHLQFESDDLLAERGFGDGVNVSCVVGRCWTNSTDPIDFEYVSGPSLTVRNAFAFEQCLYRLRCRNPRLWMTFEELSNTGTFVRLFDGDLDPLAMVPTNEAIAMSTLIMQYTSPLNARHFFTARFGCVLPFGSFAACAEGNVDVKRHTVDQPDGTIRIPMQPNNKYSSFASCHWRVECANATGGVHLTGALVAINSSDYFEITDPNGTVLHTIRSEPDNVSTAWDIFVPWGVVGITWTADATLSSRGLVVPFRYRCFQSSCFHADAHAPMLHDGIAPPRTISLGLRGTDRCRITLGCSSPATCLSIVRASANTTGVAFENVAGMRASWPRINDGEILPVSRLVLLYDQPDPDHRLNITFACFPEPRPKFCSAFGDTQVYRLWYSATEEATESLSITETWTKSRPPTVTVSAVLTQSFSTSLSWSATHELTLTVDPPPTSTATPTRTPTPPPTRTPTFSRTPTRSASVTSTLSLPVSATATRTVTLTPSVNTLTGSESERATQTRTISSSSEHTVSTTLTLSQSAPVQISFRLTPTSIHLTSLRGESTKSPLNLVFDVLGSTLRNSSDWKSVHAGAQLDVFHRNGRRAVTENGVAARLANIYGPSGVAASSTQIFVNFTVDRSLFFLEDEFVLFSFAPRLFIFDELDIEVKPIALRIIADQAARERSGLETSANAASVLSGLAAMNPGAAMQASRVSLLMDLANCQFGDGEPLSWMAYPIGQPIGPQSSPYRYHAGQAMLNAALLVAFVFLHKMLSYAAGSIKGLIITAADTWAYFPSYSLVPIAFLMQDSLSGAWVTLVYHDDVSARVGAGAVVLVVWIPFIAATIRLVGRPVTSLPITFAMQPSWSRVKRFFAGRGAWEDRGGGDNDAATARRDFGFTSRFGLVFACYRPTRTGFFIIELLFTIAFSALAAVRPPNGNCDELLIAMGVANVLLALIVTFAVPYVAIFEQIVQFMIVALQALAAMFFTVSLSLDPGSAERARNVTMGARCIAVVEVLMIAKSLLDVAMLLIEQWDRLRDNGSFAASLKDISQHTPLRKLRSTLMSSPPSATSDLLSPSKSHLVMPLLVVETPSPAAQTPTRPQFAAAEALWSDYSPYDAGSSDDSGHEETAANPLRRSRHEINRTSSDDDDDVRGELDAVAIL